MIIAGDDGKDRNTHRGLDDPDDGIEYAEHMEDLWKLAGEIGTKAERGDDRYSEVYRKLADALDEAEAAGLIVYKED